MCLYSDAFIQTQTFELDVLKLFLRDLFVILSRFLAGSCCVQKSQTFHDPLINLHRTGKVYMFKTPGMCLYFDSDVFR